MADIFGTNGADNLQGFDNSDDRLFGWPSDGNANTDTGNDILNGRNGADQLFGGGGADTLIGEDGADFFDGGAGSDTVSYLTATSSITIGLTPGAVGSGGHAAGDTFVSVENAIGSNLSDTITGSDETNIIQGGFGNDTLRGLLGDDRLQGDFGDDLLIGDAGADRLDGRDGIDTVSYHTSSVGVTVDLVWGPTPADPLGTGVGGEAEGDQYLNIENIIGSQGNDIIRGFDTITYPPPASGFTFPVTFSGNNVLNGEAGNDLLDGRGADDVLNGGAGADT